MSLENIVGNIQIGLRKSLEVLKKGPFLRAIAGAGAILSALAGDNAPLHTLKPQVVIQQFLDKVPMYDGRILGQKVLIAQALVRESSGGEKLCPVYVEQSVANDGPFTETANSAFQKIETTKTSITSGCPELKFQLKSHQLFGLGQVERVYEGGIPLSQISEAVSRLLGKSRPSIGVVMNGNFDLSPEAQQLSQGYQYLSVGFLGAQLEEGEKFIR